MAQNVKFLSHIAVCFANRRWSDLVKLMSHSQQSAVLKCSDQLRPRWQQMAHTLQQLAAQMRRAEDALAFSFVEGSLVQALKRGNMIRFILSFKFTDSI